MRQLPLADLLAAALLYAFILCCVLSAALQVLAWGRHAREGVRVSVKALWRPEGCFDAVGLRQVRLARRLLNLGVGAYLGFVLLNLLAR